MAATHDIRNAIKAAQFDLRLPMSTIGYLARVSDAKLSRLMKMPSLNLGGAEELRVRTAIASIRKFLEFAKPIPVDLRGAPEILEQCIKMMESGTIHLVIHSINSNELNPANHNDNQTETMAGISQSDSSSGHDGSGARS